MKIHFFFLAYTLLLFSITNSSFSEKSFNERLIDLEKKHRTEMDSLRAEHNQTLSQIKSEIISAEKTGHQRGIVEMLAKSAKDQKDNKNPQPKLQIKSKLKSIIIPEVQFFETPLHEVFIELQRQTRKLDQKDSPKGLNIITLRNGKEAFPNVTISLNSMPVGQMIQLITDMVSWNYEVRTNAIMISKSNLNLDRQVETEFFELTQEMIHRITEGKSADNSDPFAEEFNQDNKSKIKNFLEYSGIIFNASKGHKLVYDDFQLIATHDRRNLDSISRILRKMDTNYTFQLSISFRVLETPFGLFDQSLSETEGGKDMINPSVISRTHAQEFISKLLSNEESEMIYSPNILILDGQPVQYSFTEDIIYPTDFMALHDTNHSDSHIVIPKFDNVSSDWNEPVSRNIGLTIDLTPRLQKYSTINLELSPEISRLNGFKRYDHGIEVPIFWTWKINTSVVLNSNETMIARGASSEEGKEILMFIEASIHR
jgi:hypothetical protein